MTSANIFWLLGGAAFLLLIIACFLDILRNQGDEPQRTTLWLTLLLGFPGFGVIFYLIAGRTRRSSMGRRVADSANDFIRKIQDHKQIDRYFGELKQFEVHSSAIPVPVLDRLLPDTRAVKGNSVQLLRDGTSAYPAMLNAINNAKHYIFLQSFIIADDEIGHYILKTLEDRAKDGIEVRILYDSFGSFFSEFRRMFHRYGRGLSNFRIHPFSLANSFTRWRFQMRNHRKLLVVDGSVAFLGGINISQENVPLERQKTSSIHDLHCRIEGPITGELQLLFLRDWFYATGKFEEKFESNLSFPAPKVKGDHTIRVIGSGWGQSYEGSELVFHTAASTAVRSLWIISPYFVPDTSFISALRMASARGVDVRVIVPMNNNHFYVKMASRSFYQTLLEEGVRIFERKGVFVHTKAMLVDGEWAMIGSSNCDVRSFRLNFELDAVIRGKEFIADLKNEFENEISASDEIFLKDIYAKKRTIRDVENLCALLTPIL